MAAGYTIDRQGYGKFPKSGFSWWSWPRNLQRINKMNRLTAWIGLGGVFHTKFLSNIVNNVKCNMLITKCYKMFITLVRITLGGSRSTIVNNSFEKFFGNYSPSPSFNVRNFPQRCLQINHFLSGKWQGDFAETWPLRSVMILRRRGPKWSWANLELLPKMPIAVAHTARLCFNLGRAWERIPSLHSI